MLRQTIRLKQMLSTLFTSSYISAILLFLSSSCLANEWKALAPGIEYIDLSSTRLNPWTHIHVFRIDPRKNRFEVVLAKDLTRKYASAKAYAQQSNALITVNGGFFDRDFHPLGLRISNRKQKNPVKRISWWGIFYIKHKKPYLASLSQYRPDKQIDFALQSGPRLLINGKIPSLKAGIAERSALGITNDQHILVLVTEKSPLSTTTLARLMRSPPLNCKYALNLDGGSSTQLNANLDSFQLDVHGLSKVSDAIIVKKR